MAYATLALVTDYDCWRDEACSVQEILEILQQNNLNAHKVVKQLIPLLFRNPVIPEKLNPSAVMTNEEIVTAEKRAILNTLLK